MFPSFFDDDLCFPLGVEDYTIEQFVSEPAIETFTVSVLQCASRFNVGCLSGHGFSPVPDSLTCELGTVFGPGANMVDTGTATRWAQKFPFSASTRN